MNQILYHFSNHDMKLIEPRIGPNRHSGEDPSVVGKPAIFLTNDPSTLFEGMQYRYAVKIKPNDPFLFEECISVMFKEMGDNTTKWFYYLSTLSPVKKEIWDGENYHVID